MKKIPVWLDYQFIILPPISWFQTHYNLSTYMGYARFHTCIHLYNNWGLGHELCFHISSLNTLSYYIKRHRRCVWNKYNTGESCRERIHKFKLGVAIVMVKCLFHWYCYKLSWLSVYFTIRLSCNLRGDEIFLAYLCHPSD